jgi:hypothetical protein
MSYVLPEECLSDLLCTYLDTMLREKEFIPLLLWNANLIDLVLTEAST